MISIKIQYFSFQRILLLMIGLWPYQRSRLIQIQLNLCFGFLISFIIFQFTVFIFEECTPDLVIKVFSFVLLFIVYVTEYNLFRINAPAMKYILEQLQHICNELNDENEVAIIKKYGNIAKCLTTSVIILFGCMAIIIGSITILPYILGFVLHINETQPRVMMQLIPQYLTGQESHLYLIVLYMDVVFLIGGLTLVGTGTMLTSYYIFICGMFKIASYRIEKAFTIKMPINIDREKKINNEYEIIICKEIIRAVNIHRKAIELCLFLQYSDQKSHLLLLMVYVVCLSLNFYAIAVNISNGDEQWIEQSLIHFLIALTVFLYLFFVNYIGQEITDHNDYIFFIVYNVQWYIAPLNVQKLLLFILQRGSKSFNLNFGGIVLLSLELFATLTKASLSYFTIIYSMQEDRKI